MGTKKETLNYKQHSEPSDASTPPPYSKKIKVKDIEHDVEYTRSHMDDVIDELAERLHPRQLVHDFVDIITGAPHTPEARKVSHTTRDTLSGIGERIRHDPLPFAVIGAGLAWLAFGSRHDGKAQSSDQKEYETQPPLTHAAEAPELRETSPELQNLDRQGEGVKRKADDVGEKTRDAIGEKTRMAQDYAGSKASEAGEFVGEQTKHGREQMSHVGSQARREASSAAHAASRRVSRGGHALKDTVEHNPLAAGAVALGAGALIGLLLPHTQTEDQYLHDASQKTRENLAHRAEQATEAGKRIAAAAAASANREAHKEGVAPEQLAEQARKRSEGEPASPTQDTPVEKTERILRSGAEAAEQKTREEQHKPAGE
ncbi:MAG: DUF3618 domain-containing protein [Chitinivibrionales bacterium]